MFTLYSTLAQASAAPPQEAPTTLSVVVIGFLFVMIVLSLLAAVTTAIGAYFTRLAAQESKKAAEAAQKAAESNGQSAASGPNENVGRASQSAGGSAASEGDSAILAVIAAAVHTAIGDRPHRVVSVRSSGPGWAQEGRRQIFSSHRVR